MEFVKLSRNMDGCCHVINVSIVAVDWTVDRFERKKRKENRKEQKRKEKRLLIYVYELMI